jgi:hypothetical protein
MSIFTGTDELIYLALGLRPKETLDQISTCRRLGATPMNVPAISELISNLYGQIESNWSGRIPSKENWRVERRVTAGPNNKSPEVLLEQSISLMSDRGFLEGWYNQIPVASGLVDEWADKRAAVDLLQFDGRTASLFELKWASNNPAFAAFEVLRYGLAFLFCYLNREEFGYADSPLMSARHVSLRVLAPNEFYDTYDLGWLGCGLDESLCKFVPKVTDGLLNMDFANLAFPKGFTLPFSTGKVIADMHDLPVEAEPCQRIISAVSNIETVWADNP